MLIYAGQEFPDDCVLIEKNIQKDFTFFMAIRLNCEFWWEWLCIISQCHLHGYERSVVAMIQLSSILPEGIVEVSWPFNMQLIVWLVQYIEKGFICSCH